VLAPGIPDDRVLEEANSRHGLLVTSDKDFGELVFRLGRVHTGVVLLRLAGLSADAKATMVVETVRMHIEEMMGAFTVISSTAVRIRRSPPASSRAT